MDESIGAGKSMSNLFIKTFFMRLADAIMVAVKNVLCKET